MFWQILDISSVSNYEYVAMIARYHSASSEDTIDNRLLHRGFSEAQLQALIQQVQKENRSTVTASLNVSIAGDLNRFEYPEFDFVVNLYHIYEKTGSLPYPGSITEQPAKILELFSILDQLNLERRQREQAEQERKAKKHG